MHTLKNLVFILLVCTNSLNAQSNLVFNKPFVECENQWVVFKMGKDSTYPFGFIYIDEAAGLTLDLKGHFIIAANNTWVPHKIGDSTVGSVKYRLQPSGVRVALIPPSKYDELQITAQPDWLKFYQTDTGSIQRLFRWGFLYNSWNLSAKALSYLERAEAIDPGFKGLAFELGYAYNALHQFDKAIPVLEKALKTDPEKCYLLKELSYAQMHLGQLTDAAKTCHQAITACSDSALKSEIVYNMAYQYFAAKDKQNFEIWAAEVKKWARPGDQFSVNITKLEADMPKATL